MSLRTSPLLGALLFTGVATALVGTTAPGAAPAGSTRPVVLMLHGRGVLDPDSTDLRREWLDALNQGLVGVGSSPLLEEDDFRLVWYADALDPRAPAACATPVRPSASDAVATMLGTVGTLMGFVADLSGEHEAAALRSLAGDLLYLGDERKRCAAEERLAVQLARAAAEERPVLLVAHSFGSLVAYHHLQTRDTTGSAPVDRLITVGSLIGRPELRDLLFGAGSRRPPLPSRVTTWVNVRDPEDPFAAPLLGIAADSASRGRIRDVRTERSGAIDPHDAARYLIDPVTARAVLESWCAALPSTGDRPGGCPG
jgi:hypothetical protein